MTIILTGLTTLWYQKSVKITTDTKGFKNNRKVNMNNAAPWINKPFRANLTPVPANSLNYSNGFSGAVNTEGPEYDQNNDII